MLHFETVPSVNDGQLTAIQKISEPQYPNQGYPDSIKAKFGENLELIFGPKNSRKDYRQLTQKEVDDRLDMIPEKLWVDQTRAGMLSLLDSWSLALEELAKSKALWGVDFPMLNIMPMEGCIRYAVEDCWLNYGSQRIFYLRHGVQIVFKFDPWSVFNAIGRKDSTGKIYINDGQHRTMACLFFGLRYMAVLTRTSDDVTVDIDQFCAQNVDNLPTEPYDNFRNRNSRADIYIKAGKTPFKEDQEMYDIANWAKRWGIRICRANDPTASSNRGISHMGDILKSAKMGIENMDVAAALMIRCYDSQTIKSANLLGLTNLMNQQDATWIDTTINTAGYFNTVRTMANPKLEDLAQVILSKFGTGGENLHSACKKAVNDFYGKGNGIGPEIKVAHALYHVYSKYGKFQLTAPVNKYNETVQVHEWILR